MFTVPNVENDPVMANLVAAIEHMQCCQLRAKTAAANLQRQVGCVAAPEWIECIERALASKNKSELDCLKVRRVSATVCYEAADLTFLYRQEELEAAKSLLMDAVQTAVEAHQALEWPKEGLQSNCVLAARMTRQRPQIDPNSGKRHLIRESHARCIWGAFTTLSKRLEPFKNAAAGTHPHLTYPIYQRGEGQLHWTEDGLGIPLNHLQELAVVPASGWIPDGYDGLKRLPEALETFSQYLAKAEGAYEELRKNQRGRVNEGPYALRLLGVLDGSMSDEDAQKELEQQRENRLDFQSARLVLTALQSEVYKAKSEFALALVAAVEDVHRLDEARRYDQSRASTMERAIRVGAVNCLVADYVLHLSADACNRYNSEYKQDLTQGAGARAVADSFAELLKNRSRRA